jgi:hypothetical protein
MSHVFQRNDRITPLKKSKREQPDGEDRIFRALLGIVAITFAAPLIAQQAPSGPDISPHHTRFITVDKNVDLEVLDGVVQEDL